MEAVSEQFGNMSKVQKLAAFLLILSPENAATLLKSLDDPDLEAVSSEMAKMGLVTVDIQNQTLREFTDVAVEAATAISGGVDRAKVLLEKSVGLCRASDVLGRVSPHHAPVEAMQQVTDMEVRHIFSLLRQEQLQTVVLVTSYLSQEKASQLLAMFRPELRDQIVERLATMKPTSVQVVAQVAEGLQSKLGSNRSNRTFNQSGGTQMAAQMLNNLPQHVSKAILASLTERNAELGEAILKQMFTFEELGALDPRVLQSILQSVETAQLAIALKSADEKLKNAFFSCISKRAAETLREEISFMAPVKLSEIDKARAGILEAVRRLEAEGAINLEELRQKPRY